jgi:catechol 2,3-dioxygenase-like lactoylglutathione lyase family enzyme
MDQRVSLITLGVADLARTRAFYEAGERLREAKRRHHETGAPLWTSADRHANPGSRQVEDVAPGTP